MPNPITALPAVPDPAGNTAARVDGAWAQIGKRFGLQRSPQQSSDVQNEEQAAGLRRIKDNRRHYKLAARCYGVRPLGFVLPRETPMPVTLGAAELVGADHRRRARVRLRARDLLIWGSLPSARRATNAYMRIATSDEAEVDNARVLLAHYRTFKVGISERVGFEFDQHEVPKPVIRGLGSLPLLAFLLALIPGIGSREALLAFALIASGLLGAWVAIHKVWSFGYNQALWHWAEATTYDAKDRHRDAAEAQTAAARHATLIKTRRMGFKLPRPPRGEGYLYVVAFTTGTVKVGKTEDPKSRLRTHRAEAAAFGTHVTNYWLSPSHSNFHDNETRLINRCLKVSSRTRKEYFHEVGYDRAVQFANELTYFSANTDQTSIEGVWA